MEKEPTRLQELFKNLIPAVLSTTCIFMLSVVDGILVGRGAGSQALGAVNIAVPFVSIASAMFLLSSVGGVTIASISMGQRDMEHVNLTFMHSFMLSVVIGFVLMVLGVGFPETVATLLGGGDDAYLPYVRDYIFWWAMFAVPSSASLCLQSFCRTDEAQSLVVIANIAGTVTNLVLDWLFIFPLQMGTAGAAIATGIAQVVTFAIAFSHYAAGKGQLFFHRFKVSLKLCGEVFFRGIPDALSQFCAPMMVISMNYVMFEYFGDLGVNSFAVITYLAGFTLAIFFGASMGLQPLLGKAYGKKSREDIRYYFRAGLVFTVIGCGICMAVYIIFAAPLCRIFGAEGDTLMFASKNMWKFICGIIFAGINSMISVYFYSTKRSVQAIILNVLRSFVINTLVISTFPKVFGGDIIWFTFSIYECIILLIGIGMKLFFERHGLYFRET